MIIAHALTVKQRLYKVYMEEEGSAYYRKEVGRGFVHIIQSLSIVMVETRSQTPMVTFQFSMQRGKREAWGPNMGV